jgi:hypothetical protein
MYTEAYTDFPKVTWIAALFCVRKRVRRADSRRARQPTSAESLKCTACTPRANERSPMAEIPYTVRLAPELLERIEQIARARGIAPRKLVRAVLAERFGGERSVPDGAANETNQYRTLDQLLFDLTRTRLTLQHLLDNQVGSETTDRIRQTAQAEAECYMQRLGGRKWS